MPISVETPAEEVAAIYRDAELRIIQRIVKYLEQGIDAPDWATQKLARTQAVSAMVLRELASVDAAAAKAIEAQIMAAYERGGLDALRGIPGNPDVPIVRETQVAAARALASELVGGIASTRASVLGFTQGVIQQTIAAAIGETVTGALDRRPAAQIALDKLLGNGLAGIQLPSGRQMSMTDYVSMATRTGVANAQREAHTQTQLSLDLSLVTIEPGPRACDICDQWARCILSLDGSEGTIEVFDWATGATISVEIDATIEEAIDDGLEHPNCRCSRRTYVPGITDSSKLERPEWDAEGYALQQQQRQLERQVRNWKLEEVLSLTPAREQFAADKVDAWQTELRELVNANDELKRQPYREQIGRVL